MSKIECKEEAYCSEIAAKKHITDNGGNLDLIDMECFTMRIGISKEPFDKNHTERLND